MILNRDEKERTARCLRSLLDGRYPPDLLNVVVVDNGSRDGSPGDLAARFPGIRVIPEARNRGFGLPIDDIAEGADSEFLALLNNDLTVPPGWLERLARTALDHPEAACVASSILNADGSSVDFWGGRMNWEGRGFQALYGEPVPAAAPPDGTETFFACAAACLFRLGDFRRAGGFDPGFFAYYEDVDLCWRLQIAGKRVVMAYPGDVRHEGGVTGRRLPPSTRAFLLERNLLRSILKNFGPESLARVLPAFLAERVARFEDVSGGALAGGRGGEIPPEARALVAAAASVAADLPSLLRLREKAQAGRVVPDEDLLPRFGAPWQASEPDPPGVPARQRRACRAAGLPALFRAPLPTRVLLVSHDVAGERMAGPAIRTLEMARALSDSFEVSVAVPEGSRDPGFGLPLVPYGLRREEELKAAVRRADALVVQGFTLSEHPWVADAGVPLVVDLSCPFTLENYEFFLGHRVDPRDAARAGEAHLGVLKGLLRSGDFFLCATEEQRDFWLGMLHAVGRLDAAQYARDPTARSLIDLVPFGTPEDPPKGPGALKGKREGIGPGDFVLLWGGGIFEWFDPETLLRAVARARKRNPRLKLFFLGTKHPNPAVPEMAVLGRARALARELGLAGSGAFFHEGWVPYAERERYLVDADAGVSVHRDGLETRFSFRTRILDYFWAGLPVVTTEGDFFAGLVRREGAGVAVPEGDPEALAAALEALAADPERRRSLSEASRRLGAAYRWKKVVETLRAFLSSPRRLPPCRGSDPDRGAGGEDPAAIRERMAALEFRYRNVERLLSVLRRIPLARRTWRAFKKRRGWD